MAKKDIPISEVIRTHKPKNFKYCFIITDVTVYDELANDEFDMDELDTIHDDALVQAALQSDFKEYDRDIVAHAKKPTMLDGGIVMAKEMVTKADKKLQNVAIGYFDYQSMHYIAIRMRYVRFDILEIFILM